MDFKTLTEYIDSLSEVYGVPAADIKITKNHETVYRHSAGYSDYKKMRPVSEHDLYRLYSATKVVTMTAVMQLIERGELGLYDALTDYFPEFSKLRVADSVNITGFPIPWPDSNTACHLAHDTIRIIDLMSMTAGLSYDMESEHLKAIKKSNGQATTSEVIAEIAKMTLLFEPRTRWSYGLSLDVLAGVVEQVTGLSFGEYLQQNIFQPLEINDFYLKIDEHVQKRLSGLYQAEQGSEILLSDQGGFGNSFQVTENFESGGAGLIGTVDAYSKFVDALSCGGVGANGNRILTEESIKMFSTNYTVGQQLEDFKTMGKVGYGYGLGVRVLIDQTKSKTPLGEFGWDGAAGAYAVIDPFNHISIFYAQHILGFPIVYNEIHPKLRDLAYEAMGF
ncbi:MAG: beta-lactamase family protein [Clostridiaceae bacterium]|nr:beta-lactamase family protein [Clostridiaceae bacterium]